MPPKRKAASRVHSSPIRKARKRQQPQPHDAEENTTIGNETEIYEAPGTLSIPPTKRNTRSKSHDRLSKSQDILAQLNLSSDEELSQEETIQPGQGGRSSTPVHTQQVPATIPSYSIDEGDTRLAHTEAETDREMHNAQRPKVKRRNKYCNTCDSLKFTTDNQEVPHKLCEELADQNAVPRNVVLMGHEISLSDIKSFDLFVLNIEEKDNVKNFYLGFLLSLIGRGAIEGRFFGEYLVLWKSGLCIVVYQTEGQVPDPARLQVNTLDLTQDSDDIIRLRSFRRQYGIKNSLTIGIPKEWLYVYYMDGEKDAWENAKNSSTLGLFNVAINPDWHRLFAAWVMDPNCADEYFKMALVLLMEKIRIQLNSAIRKWEEIYGAVSAISMLIILPQYNASETLNTVSRRVYRH